MATQSKDILHTESDRTSTRRSLRANIVELMLSTADAATVAAEASLTKRRAAAAQRQFLRFSSQGADPEIQPEREGGR